MFVLMLILVISACEKSGFLTLARKQKTEYQIIIPVEATRADLKAASYLQRYFEKTTETHLPIIRDRAPDSEYEISIGKTNRLADLSNRDIPEFTSDGFYIFTEEKKVFFTSNSEKGVLYGAVSFIEKYLGGRLLSSEVDYWESMKKLRIPDDIDWCEEPVISFRSTHYRDTWDPMYADWHKLHHLPGGGHPDWGYWCHSFNQLVSPDEYYEEHPEYFAEVNGNRVATQLCLTNPDVLAISVENLRKAMEEKPDLTYWSVSQNDNVSYCQCEKCRAIDEEEGSPMGSLLKYVNAIADSFPDKVISTLSYQYTRRPPKTIKPRDNVNIMLCTIELNRSRPIETDPGAASFREDIERWAELTNDILLWDYVIQFENLVSPFPNLRVLQPNLQYLVENHADKHFQQGNREVGGEFAELRGYLISKLLWNPYADVQELMDEFLTAYYGKAGKYIRKYIDKMHDELEASGSGLGIFGHPCDAQNTYLNPELMEQYDIWFDKAEKVVKKDSVILKRVKIARLPLLYAKIELATRLGTAEGGMYIRDDKGQWIVNPDIPNMAESLVGLANVQGVTRFKEWHTTPDEYLSSLKKSWSTDMQDHLALDKKIILTSPASKKYAGGNESLLTDGLRGPLLTWTYNWLGFEGFECEAVISFDEMTEIEYLSSSWLQDQRSWIFLPDKVSYYSSENGLDWTLISEIENTADQQKGGVHVLDFSAVLEESMKIKHLKLLTQSNITCPNWHPGAGGPAWIFIDEWIIR